MIATEHRLIASFEVKAKDTKKRTFRGALSTSHLDLGNGRVRDIVWPGAFQERMEAFRTGADNYIPLVDTHDTSSIFNVYGHMLDGEEVLTGKTLEYRLRKGGTLKVPEMYFDTEWQVIDGADGDRVLDRLRPGSVRKMSMGYGADDADEVELAEGMARNLRNVWVGEGSLVVFAMQPNALIDTASVKSMLAGMTAETLTDEERRQLRRLASRIGNLLKTAPAEAADATEPEATQPDAAPDEAAPPKADPAADAESKALLERIQNIIGRTAP